MARLSGFGADTGEEARRAITSLGLTYELLTAYTSFIAVHEQVRTTEGSKTVDQPLPLPQGVSDNAVGHSVPEPELPLLLALVLLLLGLNFVREVAKSHGGTIHVLNRPEGGVLAVLTLPWE